MHNDAGLCPTLLLAMPPEKFYVSQGETDDAIQPNGAPRSGHVRK